MRKTLVIAATMFLLAINAQAGTNLNACLEYMTTNAPGSSWSLQDDGAGVYIREWRSAMPKPELAAIYAVWPQAEAWKALQTKTKLANFDNWSQPEMRALVGVLLDEINTLRAALKLPPRTKEDLKQAVQNKL